MSASKESYDESGSEPREDEAERPKVKIPDGQNPIPLFLRDGSEGRKGNAQDEKDETGE